VTDSDHPRAITLCPYLPHIDCYVVRQLRYDQVKPGGRPSLCVGVHQNHSQCRCCRTIIHVRCPTKSAGRFARRSQTYREREPRPTPSGSSVGVGGDAWNSSADSQMAERSARLDPVDALLSFGSGRTGRAGRKPPTPGARGYFSCLYGPNGHKGSCGPLPPGTGQSGHGALQRADLPGPVQILPMCLLPASQRPETLSGDHDGTTDPNDPVIARRGRGGQRPLQNSPNPDKTDTPGVEAYEDRCGRMVLHDRAESEGDRVPCALSTEWTVHCARCSPNGL
jgi:hypothetical protein